MENFTRELNLSAFIILIVVSILSQEGKIGVGTNADISNQYPTELTPEGFTFSIWGIIWLLQLLFVVFQMLPWWYDVQTPYVQRISPYFALATMLEVFWTYAFDNEKFLLSTLLISTSWICWGAAYFRLHNSKFDDAKITTTFQDIIIYCLFFLPTAMNFAWMTVASILNSLIIAEQKNISFSPYVYIGILVTIVTLALSIQSSLLDPVPSLVLIWAYYGIFSAHKSTASSEIVMTLQISMGILAVTSVITTVRKIYKKTQFKKTISVPHIVPINTESLEHLLAHS